MVRDNVEKKWMKNLQEVKQQQRTSQKYPRDFTESTISGVLLC